MKKTLLVLILWKSTIVFTTAQIIDSSIIKIQDINGNKDSVIIGTAEGATQGIDSVLGEIDLWGKPYAELEIRSIQDTSDTLFTPCSPFKENHELKKDIRGSIFDVFLFHINAVHFPVSVTLINYIYLPSYNYVWDQTDHTFKSSGTIEFKIDTVYVFKDSNELQLFYLQPFVYTKSIKSIKGINSPCGTDNIESITNKQINIYPNPCNNQLFIDAPDAKSGIIQITDITGRLIKTSKLDNGNNEINVSGVSPGYYLLSVIQNNQVIYKSTLIKQ
jgi:hypothetical protein